MRRSFRLSGGVAMLAAAAALFVLAQDRSAAEPPSSSKGPYALFEGRSDSDHSGGSRTAVFKLDEQTGTTWMFTETRDSDDGPVAMRWVRVKD